MRRTAPILLTLALLAGCGGSKDSGTSASTSTTTTTTAAAPATTATTGTTATPAATPKSGGDSPYVVVTGLLGKPLPQEPGCNFAKSFIPNNSVPADYDGGLTLSITCKGTKTFTPSGQIVNRPGNKPTEIDCQDASKGQVYCIYAPSSSVGMYFTGNDRAVTRRRLEHLIAVVSPLPTGISPLSGAAAP